ncbi:MAG: hypothetical protein R3281_18270 [Balneolaceae bacterium]|nr:hypothetical protein [Balneolaceae bacterium]
MNIGLISSYVIGGIVLIGILTLSTTLSTNTSELTLSQIKKEELNTINDLISYDLPKIGYNRTSLTDTLIVKADSSQLWFKSNIDNSADESVETVKWIVSTDPVSSTANPDDFKVERWVDGNKTTIASGVTGFTFQYFDAHGASTPMAVPVTGTDIENIKQIEIEVILQSSEKIKYTPGTDGRYLSSSWRKRFSPVNLTNN